MRRPPRLIALTVVVPVLLLSGSPSSGAVAPQSDRLYLLGADTDYLYWSPDPLDSELGLGSVSRTCGLNYTGVDAKPCVVGIDPGSSLRTHSLFFLPGAALDQPVTWSTAAPLRFRLEGAFNTFGVAYTVHVILQKGRTQVLSAPATETAPGVWEGQITSGGPLAPAGVNQLGVRVITEAPVAGIDLRLGGKSYVQLPGPFAMHGTADLMRADTFRPEPNILQTGTRTFGFNDRNWALQSFTGTTGPVREFSIDVPAKPEVFLAWVEARDHTFTQSVGSASPDPQALLQGASVKLFRDGKLIGHSYSPTGGDGPTGGLGTAALAVLDLAPGPLTLAVNSARDDEGQGIPFSLHVLEVRGERTLRMMRWQFMHVRSARLLATAVCPNRLEPVPATDEVRSLALDLDWESASPLPKYTVAFEIADVGEYQCGQVGTGDELRLTLPPAERVSMVGAAPAYGSIHLTAYDTMFEMTARYTYSPVPPA